MDSNPQKPMGFPVPTYQWNAKNIAIRVFTYPLCLCVLFLGIYALLNPPKVKCVFAGIGTMIAVSIYLYADVRFLLLSKKRKGLHS
ncbi:hypothetical protein [Parabacteroides sp. Marseille-P3160]|uniref:hypothetical protein n=1 Tax=Parabacteroides sp. Marseille-P3160 TaxID=1917887 RepID=UPI001118F475|nr:hypothetical protein [Parabacteroides sp. Marseille-P3160]